MIPTRPIAQTVVVVALAAVVASSGASSGGLRAMAGSPRCPEQALNAAAPIEDVVRAARRLLPRVYHLSNQQGPVRITRANTQILEVVWLSPYQPRLVGAVALRRTARARCGRRVADRSWAVGVYFTDVTVADNLSFAFLTKTRRGWSIWR
jgi:hypothetical protein